MPYASIYGRQIFYVHHAKGNQPTTLLFVHGLGSSHTFFETVIPDFQKRGYKCLAFDLPGSGLSDLPHDDSIEYYLDDASIDTYAGDAHHLLHSLEIGPDNVIAVGHSMGGLVVSTLATRVQLAGVVLVGGIQPTEALAQGMTKRIDAVKQNGMEAMADTIPFAATGSRSSSLHHAFIRTLLLSQRPEGYMSLCSAIANAESPDYSQIKVPVLAIAGEEDKTAPVEGLKGIIRDCSASKTTAVIVLPGVGHWHCIEAPDAVGSTIASFIQLSNA